MNFPKIIHQIWYQGINKIPKELQNNSHKIINFHKDWNYMIWDDAKIKEHFKNNKKIIDTYNKLVMTPKLRKEEVVVNDEDDKPLKDENGKVVKKIVLAVVLDNNEKPVHEIIGHVELCVLLEMMLRYLNDNEIKKNTKSKNKSIKYFLLPEMAIYYKLYKVL